LILISVVFVGHGTAQAEAFTFRQDHVLGTSFEMTVIAGDRATASAAWQAALEKVANLDAVLSTWRNDSEIARLNSESRMTVSDDLFAVLSLCEQYRKETEEAVSCRIGQLLGEWQQAQQAGQVPDRVALEQRAGAIALAPLMLETTGHDVQRPDTVVFAVDAVAKGYILDQAAEAALAVPGGVAGALLNIGGDLKVAGDLSGHIPRVGVAGPDAGDNEAPMETILLAGGAVASSGNGKRGMTIDGRAFSHIISPLTGWPQSKVSVATVVAPTAAQADALATAFAAMGIANSLSYANSHEGVETVIVTTGGARFASAGWAALLAPVVKKTAAAAGVDNPWPDGFVLDIEYEVPRIDAANYEAPYVAVWVTDPKKKLVRSLLLLGKQPRWVEENYRFWRRYGRKHPALVDTLAQPSRRPGHYRLVWDGRDDEGAPVPQGDYTLHVEASREHGGHSYSKLDLQLQGAVTEALIPAQDELGDITVHYGAAE
jgi:thiamine biosynthesis lipoprotein